MELGSDDLDARGPQAPCHQGEVPGIVIQAVNEHRGDQFARLPASASGR